MTTGDNHNKPDEEIPDDLRTVLKRRYGAVPDVSPETDAVILSATAAQLKSQRVRQPKSSRRRWMAASLVTTAAALCFVIVTLRQTDPSRDLIAMNEFTPKSAEPSAEVSRSFGIEASAAVADMDSVQSVRFDDIDQDGHIDILDAFALARQIRTNSTNPVETDLISTRPEFDRNHDGVVDQEDVDQLARFIVSL
ncbi:MAG: hypothetical protein R3C20_15630 [Planctomycetaceae bacterium]